MLLPFAATSTGDLLADRFPSHLESFFPRQAGMVFRELRQMQPVLVGGLLRKNPLPDGFSTLNRGLADNYLMNLKRQELPGR